MHDPGDAIEPACYTGRSVVFFNYTTMQMTAKIVYYGPGLCGKTTNLRAGEWLRREGST